MKRLAELQETLQVVGNLYFSNIFSPTIKKTLMFDERLKKVNRLTAVSLVAPSRLH